MTSLVTTSEKVRRFNQHFRERLTREQAASLAACAHCGLCAESCHYYLATGDPKMTPAYKADRIRRLYKSDHDWLGSRVPGWVGAGQVQTDQDLEDLKDVVFGSCTACRRCTFNCPFGVDMGALIWLARSCLIDEKVAPEGILAVMKDQWETGNQMAVTPRHYLDTLQWLEEELQAEVADPTAKVPIDKEGADFLYVVNPREVKFAPMSLLAAFKIFYVAKLSWTMGSVGWDNTNFGLFSANAKLGAHMGRLAYDQARKLRVKKLLVAECGHGWRSMKWEAPNWAVANPLPFEIQSLLELMADLISTGRIVVDPERNPHPVTYHDPCNLSRSAGITEEPRFCLQRSCKDFRDMLPNRSDSFCCTGGGGAMSMPEYAKRRLSVSQIKADQIRKTGAVHLATACHNCIDGLTDVVKENNLRVEVDGRRQLIPVRNVCEFVGDALVFGRS